MNIFSLKFTFHIVFKPQKDILRIFANRRNCTWLSGRDLLRVCLVFFLGVHPVW